MSNHKTNKRLVDKNKMFKFILYCSIIFLSDTFAIERSLIITTASGRVKGKLNEFNGIEFYSYQGIPYAESPAGKLRFKPPVPKQPWTGVLDATKEGPVCTQIPKYYTSQETAEDCLFLNVYVPKKGTDKLLPVMVFVHGGVLLYLSGNADVYGPQLLLGRQIIYVSMNYRLGPFGFLSLDIPEASGNAALKDVLLSLKWVKQNIKKFGGDSDKITLAGHSSGSLIVNFLMLTNQSHGLFNQAVQIGGTAFSPRSFAKHAKDVSFTLAKELEIETKDVYETLGNLQKIDALKIISTYYDMKVAYDSPLREFAPFVPSKEVKSDHALFVMDPIDAFIKNDLVTQNVPILIGITSQEAIYLIPHVLQKTVGVEKIKKNPEYLIPSNIEYPIGSQRSKNLGKLLNEMYFGGDMRNLTMTTLIQFISDIKTNYGNYFWIEKYRTMAGTKAFYFYIYDFNGELNGNQYLFTSCVEGVGHGDDIPYMFVSNISISRYNSVDEKTSHMLDTMLNFMSYFVYYGNPTPNDVENKFIWPDYNKESSYLLINENPVVQRFSSTPMYSRMKFWEKIYKEYYEYLENGGEIEKKIIP